MRLPFFGDMLPLPRGQFPIPLPFAVEIAKKYHGEIGQLAFFFI